MSLINPFSKVKLLSLAICAASPCFMLSAVESLSKNDSLDLNANSVVDVKAAPDAPVTFSSSYQAYQQAVADTHYAKTLHFASLSYKLGQRKFGDKSIDTANLGLNYATALVKTHLGLSSDEQIKNKAQAHQLYLNALAIYKVEYGEDSIESIDPLLGAAQTNSEIKQAKSQFVQAIDIAEDSEQPMLLASVLTSAFEGLKNTRYYTKTVRNYALEAFEIYQAQLPKDAMVRVESTYTAGMIWFAEKKESKAIPLFEEVILQFSKLDYSHPYELASHARLVQLYETEGESDKSTQHCLAIGSMKPWSEDQEQQPLFRKEPKYPISSARNGKEGWVQLAFTVDEYGFVTDTKILDSKGGSGFEKSSLNSVKKWRYAPKFVDGKAVAAQSTVQLDFTLERR